MLAGGAERDSAFGLGRRFAVLRSLARSASLRRVLGGGRKVIAVRKGGFGLDGEGVGACEAVVGGSAEDWVKMLWKGGAESAGDFVGVGVVG